MLTSGGVVTLCLVSTSNECSTTNRLEQQSSPSINAKYDAHNTADMEPLHILMIFLRLFAHVPEHPPSWHAHMYFLPASTPNVQSPRFTFPLDDPTLE